MSKMFALFVALGLAIGCNATTPPREEPPWAATARVVDVRGEQRILGAPPPAVPAQTDLQPARPLAWFDGVRFREPPRPSWTGKVTSVGPLWVTTHEELVDQSGKVLDTEVSPELAVSPSGLEVAYTRGFPNAVYVLDLRNGRTRNATATMHDANQPIFYGMDRLVVAGSATDEMYGVWLVDLRSGAARALTNGDLHIGQGLGPSFVPPPARHDSMRIVDDALVYDDGAGERRVVLGAAP